MAKVFEAREYYLVATLIYRALLDSILRRARPTTYSYGVRYLRKLGKIASKISDWRGFEDDAAYATRIHEAHYRKRKFWSMCESD